MGLTMQDISEVRGAAEKATRAHARANSLRRENSPEYRDAFLTAKAIEQDFIALAANHAPAMADAIEALLKVVRAAQCLNPYECPATEDDLMCALRDFQAGEFAGLLEEK